MKALEKEEAVVQGDVTLTADDPALRFTDRAGEAVRRWLLPLMALCLMSGILIGKHAVTWVWAAVSAAAAVTGIIVVRKSVLGRSVLAALLFLSVGTLAGFQTWHPVLPDEGMYHVTGIIADEITEGSNTQRKTLLQHVTLDGKAVRGGAYWSFYADELPDGLRPGMTVEGDFRLYHPSGADNPGGFDFREYLLQKGIRIGLYGRVNLTVRHSGLSVTAWLAGVRHALKERLIAVMGEQAGGYAATMLLGVRNLVPTEERDAFSRLGIAHVLSVSGFHVAVLGGSLILILRKLKIGRWARLPILTVLLCAYCVLAGMGAPVIRAVILILLREYGMLRHRPTEGLHLLSAAAIITLLVMPAQLTGAGFQLSYSALLALILVRPFLVSGKWPAPKRRVFRKWTDGIRIALMSSLAVQIGILLPQLYWYQELPLLSVVLNIAVLTIASMLLTGYWILLLLMWIPFVGPLLGSLAARVTELLTGGASLLASHDWITMWTRQADLLTAAGWVLVMIGLCWLWCMKRTWRTVMVCAGTAMMVLSVIPWPHRGVDYIQLSVGNADAAVLQDEGTVWVIDTGEDATLSTYLHQRRLSVDTLVITHLHKDHAMGILDLISDRIPVRRVILPEGAEEQAIPPECLEALAALEARGTAVLHAARGDVFDLPNGSMTVLWPEHGRVRSGQDANHYPLGMLFELCGVRLLTAGDLTGTYEMYSARSADLLKASHHGSKASTSAAYLEAVSPQAILLSGADSERMASLAERAPGIPVWATQDIGAVTVRFEAGRMYLHGFHESASE
ncbi:MAG: ComEC/Rec2 family competence protein [Clostridia bacterium]|nr:ComEC/Rec2 family competence protein [Clostridia bacterium]